MKRRKILKPKHEEPSSEFWLDYILLPYGEFYNTTKQFATAKKGDTLRFHNGPEYPIYAVFRIKQDKMCDFLCRMRYKCPWSVAFEKWKGYARIEGYGSDILSTQECYLVIYEKI